MDTPDNYVDQADYNYYFRQASARVTPTDTTAGPNTGRLSLARLRSSPPCCRAFSTDFASLTILGAQDSGDRQLDSTVLVMRWLRLLAVPLAASRASGVTSSQQRYHAGGDYQRRSDSAEIKSP